MYIGLVGGVMAIVADHQRSRADWCPDVGMATLLADPGLVPRVKPEGRLWNQISIGLPMAEAGSAAFTRLAKFYGMARPCSPAA